MKIVYRKASIKDLQTIQDMNNKLFEFEAARRGDVDFFAKYW